MYAHDKNCVAPFVYGLCPFCTNYTPQFVRVIQALEENSLKETILKIIFLRVLLALTIGVTGCAQAGGDGTKMAGSDQQSLAIENLSLIAKDFWQAYRSDDVRERHLAEMYLIGALDSTEGEKWCGYNIALPHSVLDQIHIGFKNASKEMMDDRASNTINKIMSNILPCKKTK